MSNDINKKVEKVREFFKKNQPQNHPITNHPIGECEEYVKNLYFDMLCVIAQYENEDVENQNQFIQRIMAGCDETMPISEHIKRAMSITVDTVTEFIKQCNDNNLKEIFFIDSLIVACGNGTPNRKQVEFLSELADVFCFDKQKVDYLSKLAVAILEQNESAYNEANSTCRLIDKDFILCLVECYYKHFAKQFIINNSQEYYAFSQEIQRKPLFSGSKSYSDNKGEHTLNENVLFIKLKNKYNSYNNRFVNCCKEHD